MERRQQVLADTKLRGVRLTHALCEATDEWIREVWTRAVEDVKVSKRVALGAVGGYGRGELAPFSDLDIMLIHDGAKNIDDLASKIWYPIWDSGLKLGHSVCTVKQATELAKSELDAATALLSVRLLAGDESLANELSIEGVKTWKAGASNRLPQLMQRVRDRQQDSGEVAFLLEPNLKEGYGGLRDIHALIWAEAAGVEISRSDRDALDAGRDVLMAVRVALHRHVGRAVEVMHLEDQDAVASLCGYRNADALVAALSNAGRSVSWVGDEVWARVASAKTKPVADQLLAPGVILHLGEIHLDETVDPATDPTLLLRVAASAARHKARIDRPTLDRLAQSCPPMPSPWPVGAIDDFVGLLLTAHDAIPVLEALDQRGLWVKVLPEWAPNRLSR